jgi:RND family efflux transporter MFP subunit
VLATGVTNIRKIIIVATLAACLSLSGADGVALAENRSEKQAQKKPVRGMPPANVVVSRVTRGTIQPQGVFIGSVYYPEVAEVPAEVSGTVETLRFEEGQRAEKGKVLVSLDSDLLEKDLQARKAGYVQVLIDLEKAKKDLERSAILYRKKIASEKNYDDQRFLVKSLEQKAAELKAASEHLEIELEKAVIKAPFSGIIVKRHVSRGEWLSPGKTVATIARDDVMDVIIEVPETVATYLEPGMDTPVTVAQTEIKGRIAAVIPRGDITTRTFPVKIRIPNASPLFEGMEARVRLPLGKPVETLLAPRDAVLDLSNSSIVALVVEGKAVVTPVDIVGYSGLKVGIRSDRITPGMQIVVKGNERLRNGQPVNIIEEIE